MIDANKSQDETMVMLNGKSSFTVDSIAQLNRCVEHIVQLISDAFVLYKKDSFSSSAFLSIAVIEEVAKVHIGMFMNHTDEYVKKDRLKDHKTKEIIGTNYTISMGERLIKAVDSEILEGLFEFIYNGRLKELRESAIYCERVNDDIVIPNNVIGKELSRNLLLLAIESFDDNLVGYTKETIDISYTTDDIFSRVAES